jgi:hypothetical protein
MACQLHKDPTGSHKFLASTGANVSLRVESDSSLAKLTAARLHGESIPVQNDSSLSFKVDSGMNIFFLTIISPNANDCGSGSSQTSQ